eukprot:scaffold47_cov112-Isochrysis_galbana.AAC.18
MSDMRASRCVLKSGYNYITLFLKLITRSSRHYSKSAERQYVGRPGASEGARARARVIVRPITA